MKMKFKKVIKSSLLAIILVCSAGTYAGNPERAGSAGAQELLINPFAGTSGWAGANTANTHGLEAVFLNVAGLAYTDKTEVIFSRTSWLGGSGIYINNFGFSQHVGETGVVGLNIMALNAGQIQVTNEQNPEGGIGTFNPTYINIGLSYAKKFSDNIFGGGTIRLIQEQISNVHATGVCIDAGVQYHTGKYDQLHFGIVLRNVGPTMNFSGDGLAFQADILNGTAYNNTVGGYTASFNEKSAAFELPSLLHIGLTYDFYLTKDSAGLKKDYRLTVAGNFTSNSFTYDQYMLGMEFAFKKYFMVRGGYMYEKGINSVSTQTAFTGPSCGATMQLPFGKTKKSTFAVDYSYRATNPFSGVNTFGFRVNL
jgi:hypothetical protein